MQGHFCQFTINIEKLKAMREYMCQKILGPKPYPKIRQWLD